MSSCSDCYFCQSAFTGKKRWACKLSGKKRFNIRLFHGWFCKYRRIGRNSEA